MVVWLVALVRLESNIRPILQLLMQHAPVLLLLLHALKALTLPVKKLSRQCVVTRRRLKGLSQRLVWLLLPLLLGSALQPLPGEAVIIAEIRESQLFQLAGLGVTLRYPQQDVRGGVP